MERFELSDFYCAQYAKGRESSLCAIAIKSQQIKNSQLPEVQSLNKMLNSISLDLLSNFMENVQHFSIILLAFPNCPSSAL